MAKLLGKGIWARRHMKKPYEYMGGCAIPRRTKSAQRHREENWWRNKDQEMPYYWRPTADIAEDHEWDCRHGCTGGCPENGCEDCTAACH